MQYHWVGENNAPDTKNHKESLPPVGCVVSDNNTFLQYCAPELLHKIVLFQDIIADGLGKEVSISRHLIIAANNLTYFNILSNLMPALVNTHNRQNRHAIDQ
jgi:hypothetical protein